MSNYELKTTKQDQTPQGNLYIMRQILSLPYDKNN